MEHFLTPKHKRPFYKSLSYALRGILFAVQSEANMKRHLVIALLVTIAGFILAITHLEWIIISFAIALVLFAELMNTALEANVDLVTKERRYEAMLAKDTAAGAVLVTSINAAIIGLIIFIPHIKVFIETHILQG